MLQRQEEGEEEEEPIMTKRIAGKTQQLKDDLHMRLNRSSGSGQTLPETDRGFMERRFGVDFSNVRVHRDSNAVQMSKELNAQAFTHGRDIYFGAGRYSPGTLSGKRLLAHEMTHVVQQSGQKQTLQRFVACEGADLCPRRDRGELRRSRSTPHQVEIYQPTTFGVLISNFAINEHRVKPDLSSNSIWIQLVGHIGSTAHREWKILGFTDCQGSETTNRSLRRERATEVASLLPVPTIATARLGRIDAAILRDCISSNLSESGRSRNRSVLIRRLPGSTGPTAPTPPIPIGPVRPPRSPGRFCVPYTGTTGTAKAADARRWLHTVWLPLARVRFGTEVYNLWRDYLNRPKGSSLAPRVFRGRGHRIVDAFRTDPQTVHHQRLLYADIRTAAARTPEANVPFTGNRYTSPPIPLGTLLSAAALIRTINYVHPASLIPGNIAGGTGVMGTSSSDAGPDLRLFTGTVRILRTRPSPGAPEVRIARIEMQLQVIDAIDFCPGAAGGTLAQLFTIPMSRLEATPTELTYDLPFHVFVDLSGTVPIP